MNTVFFDSRYNYLKRATKFGGTDTVSLAAVGMSTTKIVTHNLTYPPFYQIASEIDNDGIVWSGGKIDKYTETSLTGVSYPSPQIDSWVTSTDLTIRINNTTSPVATGTRRVYWILYLDYGS